MHSNESGINLNLKSQIVAVIMMYRYRHSLVAVAGSHSTVGVLPRTKSARPSRTPVRRRATHHHITHQSDWKPWTSAEIFSLQWSHSFFPHQMKLTVMITAAFVGSARAFAPRAFGVATRTYSSTSSLMANPIGKFVFQKISWAHVQCTVMSAFRMIFT